MERIFASLRLPRSQVAEALTLWAVGFGAIVLAFVIAPAYAKPVATVSFLYLPLIPMRRRGEDYADYGLVLRHWREDLRLAALVFVIVAPPFVALFIGFPEFASRLPPRVAHLLTPFVGSLHFHPRLPDRFGLWVLDQIFVVAVPEEFFYRGYLQTRLSQAWPTGRRFLGAKVGPAFFATAALFALGHLAIFQAWRLAVFFPALLFGWLRERTGTVIGAAALHAAFNLLELVLESSFV